MGGLPSQTFQFCCQPPRIYEMTINCCAGSCSFQLLPKQDCGEERVLLQALIKPADGQCRQGKAFV
ncbi:hypothetical protein AD953_02295 [Acetobacter malorum]|uniref:Uncharacterized protein n=2 Tax=Acetobacter malorum TaxID=178901 RepID=A0A149VGU6_9PROT|nr:hypothetical protein AD953_02295 [Acetobacter malorum]